MENFKELKELLKSSKKNIVIIPHSSPDADALGSSLAMNIYLKKLGNHSVVISPNNYAHFLFWMPGHNEVVFFEKNRKYSQKLISEADLLFFIDFSNPSRMGDLRSITDKVSCKKVVIDHHLDQKKFADFELWDIQAAATAELVYNFIVMMGDKHLLDKDMASCIYAGIMTDTGSFKFSSTNGKVHRIIAELLDLGLDNARIHYLIYDNNSPEKVKFLGYILSEKLRFLDDYHTAYITINEEELKQFKAREGDTEGLVNYGLTVENIKLASIFIQKKNDIKISFRSIGDFSVNKLSSKYFNGGGHKNAAGGMLYQTTMEEAIKLFLNILPQYEALTTTI